MDLRKLREHSDSELQQFKRKMRASARFFITLGTIISMAVTIYVTYIKMSEQNQIQQNPVKVYKAPELRNLQGGMKNRASGRATVETDADLSTETLTNSLSTEKYSVEKSRETGINEEIGTPASTPPIDSKKNLAEQKKIANEEARKRAEELKAEVDQTLVIGNEIMEQARNTLEQTVPILVSHLKTLSREEQVKYLKQARAQMYKQSIPEVQEIMDKSPEIVEQGWQMFLDMLAEHGYTPPKGIE